jgi:signal peptidase II
VDKKYFIFAWVNLFLIFVDQSTKIYIHTQFMLGESKAIIEGFFNITYVRNLGAAFGLLSDSHETFRHVFFLSVPLIAVIIIFFMLRSTPGNDRWQVWALSAISGGALGNYIDRIRFGYVIDFLDFHYRQVYSYPAFNVADSAIVCGVMILSALIVRDMRREKTAQKNLQKNVRST